MEVIFISSVTHVHLQMPVPRQYPTRTPPVPRPYPASTPFVPSPATHTMLQYATDQAGDEGLLLW